MTPLTFTEIVAADGSATILVTVPNAINTWRVSQVSIEMPGAPAGATCNIRLNNYVVSPAIASSDTIAGDPPVTLRPADMLTIEWAGCTPGSVGRALVFYDDLGRK